MGYAKQLLDAYRGTWASWANQIGNLAATQ